MESPAPSPNKHGVQPRTPTRRAESSHTNVDEKATSGADSSDEKVIDLVPTASERPISDTESSEERAQALTFDPMWFPP
eukprot:382505-Amphidinium_carterae.1